MLVDINKINANDRIRKEFGDIEELAKDIQLNGLINPPVVIPEEDGTFTLLAGERRLRACRVLGFNQIEVRTWRSLNDEEKLNIEISENEARKSFTKTERLEYASRLSLIEVEKALDRMLSGKEQDPTKNSSGGITGEVRNIIAKKLGIGSGWQYEREKFIAENRDALTPAEFADWDEGRISTNKAYMKIKAQKEKLEQAVQALQEENEQLKNRPAAIREVDRTDYALADKQRSKIMLLEEQLKDMTAKKNHYENYAKLTEEDAKKYRQLKKDMEVLTKQRSEITQQINAATELSGLVVRIRRVLEEDLAPIKYKRCMEALGDSEVARQNLADIVYQVSSWVQEMEQYVHMQHVDSIIIEE